MICVTFSFTSSIFTVSAIVPLNFLAILANFSGNAIYNVAGAHYKV
jgi:hypothetical protein